jgi:hypothetical protein
MQKLAELAKFVQMWVPAARSNATATLYNSDTSTGSGLDTRDYDEVTFVVNVGAITAGSGVALSVYENDVDTADTATAVSGATFTPLTANTMRTLSVRSAGTKRYLWVRSVATTTGASGTAAYGITAVLDQADKTPVNTPTPDAQV